MSDIVIPGFELIELLGRGGMAEVWKARQVSLDRVVAIKILSSHFSSDAADIDRFQDEARAAARLKHSGIVQVYDASTQDGVYYFVMEYVAGYTIGSWLSRKGVLDESDALLTCECVADALDYAWTQASIIHCDIKPENVIVDSDGTVKVADLGLSRTISGMSRVAEETDEVMGTPSYISPEQAMGEPDLDCRADVYSLGAMLYHLVTGHRPFKGHPDADVMDLQCKGQLASPASVVPGLSVPLCLLLEKMMAKDRAHRHADWQEVKADIARVKRGHPPRHPLPADAETTVTRMPRPSRRQQIDPVHRNLERWKKRNSPFFLALGAFVGVVLLLVLVLFIVVTRIPRRHVPAPRFPAKGVGVVVPAAQPKPKTAEERAAEAYGQVSAWVAAHPDERAQGMRRLGDVRRLVVGTSYAAQVDRDLTALRENAANARQEITDSLQAQAEQFEAGGEWHQAAAVYTKYAGEMVDETLSWRMQMAESVRIRAQQSRVQEGRSAKVNAADALAVIVSNVVATLMESGPSAAALVVREALRDGQPGPLATRLSSLEKVLLDTAQLDSRVIRSFGAETGQDVTVNLRSGPRLIRVEKIADGRVHGTSQRASAGVVSAPVAFGIDDLTIAERLKRMGDDSLPEVALGKGLMAERANALSSARDFFGGTHELIAGELQEFISRKGKSQREPDAAPPPVPAEPAAGVTPDVPAPVASVALILPRALQAVRDDVSGVHKILLEKNANLAAADVTIGMDGPSAVSVEILSAEVNDIGPLAALTTVKSFVLIPPRNATALLLDISALSKLPLTKLVLERSRVNDLSAVADAPLTYVSIKGSPVRDLAPLRRKAITYLDVGGSKVQDLGPLAGMPLTHLDFSETMVHRLSVLSGMPLTSVIASGCKISEISFLEGLRLTRLSLADTQVKDLSVLSGMPLRSLDISRTRVVDVSPLALTKLTVLTMSGVDVREFLPIRGLPIERLDVSKTTFDDTALLAEMPLTSLNCAATRIDNLKALEGKKLTLLNIENTGISDLLPLRNMPLAFFACRASKVKDLSPLKGAPIRTLNIDDPENQVRFTRSLPQLAWLNGKYVVRKF